MQVNAVIKATSTAGKKINTTISHLRESQESKAEQLGIALNALTTNTYESTQINEIGVTDFTPSKQTPTITLASKLRLYDSRYFVDVLTSDIPASYLKLTGQYTKSSTITPLFTEPTDIEDYKLEGAAATFLLMTKTNYDSGRDFQFYITAPETTNYTALYQNATLIP